MLAARAQGGTWAVIAATLPGRSDRAVLQRYNHTLADRATMPEAAPKAPGLVWWSEDDDRALLAAHALHPNKHKHGTWAVIAAMLPERSERAVQQRLAALTKKANILETMPKAPGQAVSARAAAAAAAAVATADDDNADPVAAATAAASAAAEDEEGAYAAAAAADCVPAVQPGEAEARTVSSLVPAAAGLSQYSYNALPYMFAPRVLS